MRRAYLFAVLPVLAATPAFATPAASTAGVDPSVIAAIKSVKPADYPSANDVLVVNDQSVVYQKDGTFTNTTHMVELVLTEAGKNEASSLSLDYAKDAEKMQVLSAKVIKADGTVVPVPASDIKDTEQSGQMNIYDPNGRSLKVTFDGLAVGDAVDITSELTQRTPTRTGFFNDIFQFQAQEPILEASYSVDAPAALPLTSKIYHPERGAKIAFTQTTAGDRIHYRWSVEKAPQLIPELAMDVSTELPTLIVTTDPSWQHFSAWWAGVTAPQMQATAAIKEKVAELTKDAKTDDAKIKALYDFVSSDVRYRGLGVGPRTGYTPRKAADTLSSRWGVCRDVAILLATMLRADGFQAYPVLTNVGDPVLPAVAYDGFNHAIVAMPRKGGGWTYLDPTAKNNSNLLPGYEREQSALVCTPQGETLGIIPAGDPAANLGHAVAESVVGADGAMSSTVKIESKGMFDLLLRSVGAMVSPEQQHEMAEQAIHAALPQAKLVSFHLSNPLALSTPMEVDLQLQVPGAAVKAGDYRLLRTLVTSGALGLVENLLPRLLGGLPTRKYTLDAHVTFEYDEDETVTVPPGTRMLALPNDADAANAVSALTSKCTQSAPTTIACHRSFKLKSRFIDPNQYTELRSVLASLGQIAHQPVILGGAGSK